MEHRTEIDWMIRDDRWMICIPDECLEVSHVFETAAGESDDPGCITPFEQFQQTQPMMARFMDLGSSDSFYDLLTCFAAWTYSRRIFRNAPWHVELWRLGQIIASPIFMNDILRDLCSYLATPCGIPLNSNPEGKRPVLAADLVKRCWDQANFMREDHNAIMMDVKWENKKMLKFLIDIYAHKAIHEKDFFKTDEGLKELLTGRDQLALQMARAIGSREKTKKAPWHAECIGEYLVNEDMSERRFESDCRWEESDCYTENEEDMHGYSA